MQVPEFNKEKNDPCLKLTSSFRKEEINGLILLPIHDPTSRFYNWARVILMFSVAYFKTRIFESWHYWHFEHSNLLLSEGRREAISCTLDVQQYLWPLPIRCKRIPSYSNEKYLQTLPTVLWETKSLLIENHYLIL